MTTTTPPDTTCRRALRIACVTALAALLLASCRSTTTATTAHLQSATTTESHTATTADTATTDTATTATTLATLATLAADSLGLEMTADSLRRPDGSVIYHPALRLGLTRPAATAATNATANAATHSASSSHRATDAHTLSTDSLALDEAASAVTAPLPLPTLLPTWLRWLLALAGVAALCLMARAHRQQRGW